MSDALYAAVVTSTSNDLQVVHSSDQPMGDEKGEPTQLSALVHVADEMGEVVDGDDVNLFVLRCKSAIRANDTHVDYNLSTGCEVESECITQASRCKDKNNLSYAGELGAGKIVSTHGSIVSTECGVAFECSCGVCAHTTDTGMTAVGIQPCGDPEKCTKTATEGSVQDGNVTSRTDETYNSTGVGCNGDVLSDVLNTSKLHSESGVTCPTGLIIHDEHNCHTVKQKLSA